MRVAIGSDHAGFELKEAVKTFLAAEHFEVVDVGTDSQDPVDYHDYAQAVGAAVRESRAERGILLCGRGGGASVVAHRIPGIRAGLCHDTYSAHQGVEHDDMNVLVLGGRVIGIADQPEDRGTGAAILLAAHRILRRDPEALVWVFPSDHSLLPVGSKESTCKPPGVDAVETGVVKHARRRNAATTPRRSAAVIACRLRSSRRRRCSRDTRKSSRAWRLTAGSRTTASSGRSSRRDYGPGSPCRSTLAGASPAQARPFRPRRRRHALPGRDRGAGARRAGHYNANRGAYVKAAAP